MHTYDDEREDLTARCVAQLDLRPSCLLCINRVDGFKAGWYDSAACPSRADTRKMTKRLYSNWCGLCIAAWNAAIGTASAAESPRNIAQAIPQGQLPLRVHVLEDYETDI